MHTAPRNTRFVEPRAGSTFYNSTEESMLRTAPVARPVVGHGALASDALSILF